MLLPFEHRLPEALLAEAGRLASLGAYRMAVVVAGSAVDVLVERQPPLQQDARYLAWHELGERIQAIRCSDEQPPSHLVIEILTDGRDLVDDNTVSPNVDRRTSQALL